MAFGAAVALAELDGLVQHHLERRLRMRRELEGADIEDRALDRRKPREIAVEVRHDQALQLVDAVAHARHQGLDEAPIALLEPLQAAHLLDRIAARELPGIERLQRELARLAPTAFHRCSAAISPSRAPPALPRRPFRAAPRPAPRLPSSGCHLQSAGRSRAPRPSGRAPTRSPPPRNGRYRRGSRSRARPVRRTCRSSPSTAARRESPGRRAPRRSTIARPASSPRARRAREASKRA